jgi:hypothetical protein
LVHPFNSYCAEYKKDPVNDAYDLETLRDFIQKVAYSVEGCGVEDGKQSLKSVISGVEGFHSSVSTAPRRFFTYVQDMHDVH